RPLSGLPAAGYHVADALDVFYVHAHVHGDDEIFVLDGVHVGELTFFGAKSSSCRGLFAGCLCEDRIAVIAVVRLIGLDAFGRELAAESVAPLDGYGAQPAGAVRVLIDDFYAVYLPQAPLTVDLGGPYAALQT